MAESQKVRVGIIGAGGIAQVSHIPCLRVVPGVDIVAICDSDIARAASVADRFGVREWFEDPVTLINEAQPDCVVISTPTISHLPLSQTALENGVDVMVEKPFARNSKEAARIVELAEKNHRILMVGMNHRFREDTALLKEALEDEALGELYAVNSAWLKRLGVWGRPYWFTDPNLAGGGVLLDLGLQMVDLVLYLLDYPAVVEARCSTSNKLLGLDVEDSASVFLRFEDDVAFLLEVSWANCYTKDRAYTFFSASQGSAFLNPLRLNRRERDRVFAESTPILTDEVELYRRSFQMEMIHFIECVRKREEPVSSGREALLSLRVIDRLYESAGH